MLIFVLPRVKTVITFTTREKQAFSLLKFRKINRMFPWPRAFLHLLWSPRRVNLVKSVSCCSKDRALGIVRGALGVEPRESLGPSPPPPTPAPHIPPDTLSRARTKAGPRGHWGLCVPSVWRLGDRLQPDERNRDLGDPVRRVLPALRRVRCLHRASSLKETGTLEASPARLGLLRCTWV